MRRREFVSLIGAIASAPRAVLAQSPRRRPLVGRLVFVSKDNYLFTRYNGDLLAGMQDLQYLEDRDFDVVYRFADFHADRMAPLAVELVQLNPDVIVGAASIDAVAIKKATNTIPIVIAALGDPIALGLIASFAHPGGNITGIMPYVKGLPSKQLELARELVPGATRIGLIDDVTDPKAHPQRTEIETTGRRLGLTIVPAEVHTSADIGTAYEALTAAHVQVVITEQSSMLVSARRRLAEAAEAKKLPTVYGYEEHVEVGGLISYGVNLDWCFHRVAYYVVRILKGDKPADLPVEFPTTLELEVNLGAAKAIGIKIPSSILVKADKVVE